MSLITTTIIISVVLIINGCVSLHLSTSPPPKKTHFIPSLNFFQRTKTTKLKVKVNVFAAQVHVEDLVVAHIEQNLTMCNTKLG